MPSETAVSSQVDPSPMENAAPGLRIRFSLIIDPTSLTASPGVSADSAHTFVTWSITRTPAETAGFLKRAAALGRFASSEAESYDVFRFGGVK